VDGTGRPEQPRRPNEQGDKGQAGSLAGGLDGVAALEWARCRSEWLLFTCRVVTDDRLLLFSGIETPILRDGGVEPN
jgi:hypothetical protein